MNHKEAPILYQGPFASSRLQTPVDIKWGLLIETNRKFYHAFLYISFNILTISAAGADSSESFG